MRTRAHRSVVPILLVATYLLTPGALLADDWISFEDCKSGFTPPDDRATVYFYRPKKRTATGVNFWIYDESEKGIALILNNYFVPVFLPPGVHDLTTQKTMVIKPVEFSLDLEAGKTYFVRTAVKASGMKNIPVVEEVSEEQGSREIQDCRLYINKEVKKDPSRLPEFLGLEEE